MLSFRPSLFPLCCLHTDPPPLPIPTHPPHPLISHPLPLRPYQYFTNARCSALDLDDGNGQGAYGAQRAYDLAHGNFGVHPAKDARKNAENWMFISWGEAPPPFPPFFSTTPRRFPISLLYAYDALVDWVGTNIRRECGKRNNVANFWLPPV